MPVRAERANRLSSPPESCRYPWCALRRLLPLVFLSILFLSSLFLSVPGSRRQICDGSRAPIAATHRHPPRSSVSGRRWLSHIGRHVTALPRMVHTTIADRPTQRKPPSSPARQSISTHLPHTCWISPISPICPVSHAGQSSAARRGDQRLT
jgi:hypothetical protein